MPITWTASDNEPLRAIDILVSTDGGRWWNTIVQGLPGSTVSFDWDLPASDGVADTRIRVVVRDSRFQNSQAVSGTFSITPGDGCPVDINSDGQIDSVDFFAYLTAFAAGDSLADWNNDGQIDSVDFFVYLDDFVAGC